MVARCFASRFSTPEQGGTHILPPQSMKNREATPQPTARESTNSSARLRRAERRISAAQTGHILPRAICLFTYRCVQRAIINTSAAKRFRKLEKYGKIFGSREASQFWGQLFHSRDAKKSRSLAYAQDDCHSEAKRSRAGNLLLVAAFAALCLCASVARSGGFSSLLAPWPDF
jgi:hypothetical protein